MLAGESHPLRAYYASCVADPGASDEVIPHFKDFAISRSAEIGSLPKTKLVQTNEVRRSAYLLSSSA